MKSQFHYLNPDLSFQILISVMKSQFHYMNTNFSIQILISLMKSQFRLQSPIFSITILLSILEIRISILSSASLSLANGLAYWFSLRLFFKINNSFVQRTSFSCSMYLSLRFIRQLWFLDIL